MYELESMLEHHGLAEFQPGRWCQNGAQAGWSPDLDDTWNTPIEVNSSNRSVTINNDVYSERVKEIAKAAKALGYEVKVRNTYDGS